MPPNAGRDLREGQRWLERSAADAERLLPQLLALARPALYREFRVRPELRTAGVLRGLLRVAREALDVHSSRARELALVVLRYARTIAVPDRLAAVVSILQGEAWRDYAAALRESGGLRPARVQRALARARSFFATVGGSGWYVASVDLVEEPFLHDLGRRDQALALIRRAVHQFSLFRDDRSYLQARMFEIWMMGVAGDVDAEAALRAETAAAAAQPGGLGMAGRFAARMGMVALRYGRPAEAMDLLRLALARLAGAGLHDDELLARWHYAHAAAECGTSRKPVPSTTGCGASCSPAAGSCTPRWPPWTSSRCSSPPVCTSSSPPSRRRSSTSCAPPDCPWPRSRRWRTCAAAPGPARSRRMISTPSARSSRTFGRIRTRASRRHGES